MHLTIVLMSKMDQMYAEGSTDTESITEILSGEKGNSTKKLKGKPHKLYKQAVDEQDTDDSEIEGLDYDAERNTNCTGMRKLPSGIFKDSMSKTFYQTSMDKGSKKRTERPTTFFSPLKNDEDLTDGEDLEFTSSEFLKIVQEELNSRGHAKLTLKSHNTTVTLQKTNMIPEKLSTKRDDHRDDTDCSDVDVSMIDYYTIRHQNQSSVHKKKIKQQRKGLINQYPYSDDEEDPFHCRKVNGKQEDDSEMSDLEVNIKDYYVIRHETAPKSVSGPFEIDFGQTTFQCSSLKKSNRKNKKAMLVPICPDYDEKDTDDEDISFHNDEMMNYKEFLQVCKNQTDLKKNSCDLDDESEADIDSESIPTECDAEELSLDISKSQKGKPPIIRLIEIDGCQGAVGVICEPCSPTKDNVHGIKFVETNDKTETFSNLSEAEEDAEIAERGKYEPATDDEELSDLEDDTRAIPRYVLPECGKKVCHIKTTIDGKTVSSENQVKLNQVVTLKQFVRETEDLSASDVNDWSEEEANIARRMSGDFTQKKSPVPLSLNNPSNHKSASKTTNSTKNDNKSSNKKGGRTRKRGRKKSDGKETKPNNA